MRVVSDMLAIDGNLVGVWYVLSANAQSQRRHSRSADGNNSWSLGHLSSRLRLFTCQKRWRGHVNTIDLLSIRFDQKWTLGLECLTQNPNIAALTRHKRLYAHHNRRPNRSKLPSLVTGKRYKHQASRTATSRGTTIPATSQNPTSNTKQPHKTTPRVRFVPNTNPSQNAHLPAQTPTRQSKETQSNTKHKCDTSPAIKP